jgi:hypothetical protein
VTRRYGLHGGRCDDGGSMTSGGTGRGTDVGGGAGYSRDMAAE